MIDMAGPVDWCLSNLESDRILRHRVDVALRTHNPKVGSVTSRQEIRPVDLHANGRLTFWQLRLSDAEFNCVHASHQYAALIDDADAVGRA